MTAIHAGPVMMAAGDGNVTPVTQGVTLVLVGGMITVLTIWLNNRNNAKAEQRVIDQTNLAEAMRREEKEEDRQAVIDKEQRDYARLDLVAERAEQATRQTLERLRDVEDLGKSTHALVNADRTAGMRHQLNSMKVTLALMHEVIDLKGTSPTQAATDAITTIEVEIAELTDDIVARVAEQTAAEERIVLDKAQTQIGTSIEAADRQIEAAAAQQSAADRQIEAAKSMAAATEPLKPTPETKEN